MNNIKKYNDFLNKSKKLNEKKGMSDKEVREWLYSFLKSTGVDFRMFSKSVVLMDDIHEVELKIYGGKYKDDIDESLINEEKVNSDDVEVIDRLLKVLRDNKFPARFDKSKGTLSMIDNKTDKMLQFKFAGSN